MDYAGLLGGRHVPADVALDALYGPLYHRLLLPYDGTDVRLSDGYVESLIDTVFSGLAGKDEK